MKTMIALLTLVLVGCGDAPPPDEAPSALTARVGTPPASVFEFIRPPGPGCMSGWWRGELDGQPYTASFAETYSGGVHGGIRKGEWLADGAGSQWDVHGARFGSTAMGHADELVDGVIVAHPMLISLVETLWIGIMDTPFQVTFVAAPPQR